MLSFKNIIFDCDGVVLDSNKLKIDAMFQALKGNNISDNDILNCINYFKNNFGKSRYEHVDKFSSMLNIELNKELILKKYSKNISKKYPECAFTENFTSFFRKNNHTRFFIVSGSDQDELRKVFKYKDIDIFDEILGSPTKKAINLRNLISSQNLSKEDTCYIGDSVADIYAAKDNDLNFIGYTPYSNNKDSFIEECIRNNYKILEKWQELA